jgi:large subunit ribosomal protein L15
MPFTNRKRGKIQKMRGSKACGGGSKKKRRNKGHKGGKGMAGTHKGRWTWVVKYDPMHFGKHGFNPPMRSVQLAINLRELDGCLDAWVGEGKATRSKDSYEVDLGALGFDKVLGTGRLTRKVRIKAPYFTEKARSRIEESGGAAEAPAAPAEGGAPSEDAETEQ